MSRRFSVVAPRAATPQRFKVAATRAAASQHRGTATLRHHHRCGAQGKHYPQCFLTDLRPMGFGRTSVRFSSDCPAVLLLKSC
ncbi:unnamed protein product [Sphagnum troendelagicum]|uniref:Uncharacterized protein n=1 Tax=Sphagnum troendelagicum TaxID=128251 RepID=A0ABP0U0C5_9BRYO